MNIYSKKIKSTGAFMMFLVSFSCKTKNLTIQNLAGTYQKVETGRYPQMTSIRIKDDSTFEFKYGAPGVTVQSCEGKLEFYNNQVLFHCLNDTTLAEALTVGFMGRATMKANVSQNGKILILKTKDLKRINENKRLRRVEKVVIQ